MSGVEERLRDEIVQYLRVEGEWNVSEGDREFQYMTEALECLAARGLAVVEMRECDDHSRKLHEIIVGLLHLLEAVQITKVGDAQFVHFAANGYYCAVNAATKGVSGRIVVKCLNAWGAKRTDAVRRARELLVDVPFTGA